LLGIAPVVEMLPAVVDKVKLLGGKLLGIAPVPVVA